MAEEIEQIEQEEVIDSTEETTKKKSSGSGFDFGMLEVYYERNKKAINYIGLPILAIIALFGIYKLYYVPGQEKEASSEAFYAQNYFEVDSFNIALNGLPNIQTPDGPKPMMGFKEIAEAYGSTKTGNLANFYSGICLLRTGKYAEAIEFLEKFDGSDEMLAPVAIGAIGDANMELNNIDEALKFYLKAADKSDNEFTTPIFLKKAALAYELKANYTEALATYERLRNEYSKSTEARDADKYIAKMKVLGNIQ